MAVEHELMEHARKLARDEMFAAEKARVEEQRKYETEIDRKVEKLLALVDLDQWDFKVWLERELGT